MAAALAALLAACSGGGPDGTASPVSPVETAEPRVIEAVDDLAQLCEDVRDGYPEAAAYTGEGPHSIAIFVRDNETSTEAPSWRQVSDDALDDWTPGEPAEAQLLACGDPDVGTKQVDTCEYQPEEGRSTDAIPLYDQDYLFSVYELRTGRLVETLRADPSARCPTEVSYESSDRAPARVFDVVRGPELVPVFEDVVNGALR